MNARHLTFLKSDCGPPENFASGAWANWLNGRLAPISVSTPAFGNRRLPLRSCPSNRCAGFLRWLYLLTSINILWIWLFVFSWLLEQAESL